MLHSTAFSHRRSTANTGLYPSLSLFLVMAQSCIALEAPKQITQYVLTAITVKNGLPQNTVSTIAQTRDGYIWFGTQEGIGRYDGLRITVFDTAQHRTLKDNYIEALSPGHDGSLWVATRSSLVQLKEGRFRTLFIAQSPINSICEAQDGQVWVGTLNGLYAVRNSSIRLFTTRDGLPGNAVRSILQTADGRIWLATNKGLASFKNGVFRSYDSRDGLLDEPVLALAPSHDGALWIAFSKRLMRWKGKLLETVTAERSTLRDDVTSLLEDHAGVLWIGFDHSGIAVLRNGQLNRYTVRQGLPSGDVATLFEDRDGHIWAGLSEGGVVELRDGIFSNFGVLEGLSEDMVWSVIEARDKSIWVGTNSKGLDHIDKDGHVRAYTERDGLPGGSVYALREGLDGSIWFGAENGSLCQLKDGRIRVYTDPLNNRNRVVSILPDPSGDLWLAFHEVNGLVRFHQGHFQHFAVPGLLNTASFARDGSIWLGTDHAGVSQWRNGSITRYTTDNGLLANFAQAIYIDRDGVVWVGTSPGGLNRIKNGRITTYSIDQGLFDLTVGAIVEDDEGYLWMTCNKGIYKVSKKELDDYADGRIAAIHSSVYGTADGLRSPECNFAADPPVWKGMDGRLWFATTAGIASVNPKQRQIVNADPTPMIEGVLVNQHPVPFDHGVTAGPGVGDLEIQFTTPDFVAPERIRFRYRLQGSDSDWVVVGGRRQAFYTKLPPRRYRFEVQAADEWHDWSPAVAALEIHLTPRFWQTNTFRALFGMIVLLAGIAIYWLRIHYLVVNNRILEEKVQQRTKELQLALKAAEDAGAALHDQATRDGLTGLWNRNSIFEMLNNEVARAHRDHLEVTVLMADLDHFKLINDTYGHQVGDQVLQVVAERFMLLTRTYDFVGRYGGEEFVMVLPGCSLDDGIKRANEFRVAIHEEPILTSVGPIHVTCSFGVAEKIWGSTAEGLMSKADEGLYSAKNDGRNCVRAISLQAAS